LLPSGFTPVRIIMRLLIRFSYFNITIFLVPVLFWG
jgi:hypothetical protein